MHSSTRGPHLRGDQEADVVAGDWRAAQDIKVVGALHQERHLFADQPLLQQVLLAHLPPRRRSWAPRLCTGQGRGERLSARRALRLMRTEFMERSTRKRSCALRQTITGASSSSGESWTSTSGLL